jgi:hypothetical protein
VALACRDRRARLSRRRLAVVPTPISSVVVWYHNKLLVLSSKVSSMNMQNQAGYSQPEKRHACEPAIALTGLLALFRESILRVFDSLCSAIVLSKRYKL